MGLESTFISYQMHGASKIVANISMYFLLFMSVTYDKYFAIILIICNITRCPN